MQIPIFDGIYADVSPDFRTSYPINMVPVPKATGISAGYLRPSEGIVESVTGPGISRGAVFWQDKIYAIMGTQFVSIDSNNTVTQVPGTGIIPGINRVRFTYGFDALAFQANENLYVFRNDILTLVTDTDVEKALDTVWIDGYFMYTDGEFLVVTELNDPTMVNPLKYGSSEADPDPIVALQVLRNEVYAINEHTIEVFSNRGGEGFPFQRNAGAKIPKGCVGTHANCVFMEQIAFIGGGYNEAPSIYLGLNGRTRKIASREIDQILKDYTQAELKTAFLQEKVDLGHQHLIIQLPRHTLVFDGAASEQTGSLIWFHLSSEIIGEGKWKADSLIWAFDKWSTFHTENAKIGYLDPDISTQWGEKVGWRFGTLVMYNDANGVLFHELELIGLTGSTTYGLEPVIWTQYSEDGVTWSNEKAIDAGDFGERQKRLVWFRQGKMTKRRMQRFRGTSDAHITVAALEARIEALLR